MKIIPFLYALILFLLIRLAVDVPAGINYFAHSVQFIVIELLGIIIGSYAFFYLAVKWIVFCIEKSIHAVIEYGLILVFPMLCSIIIMRFSHGPSLSTDMSSMIIPILITELMSVWLYLMLRNNCLIKLYSNAKLREQEAKNAEKETELKYLRLQFQPHFLFNMLNTIYFSIHEDNECARDMVEHLSNLLRFQLYHKDGEVPINREISALESYIAICRMRFGDLIEIAISIDNRYDSDKIHPYLLLPLVENAFKHSGGKPWKVSVKLKRDVNIVELSVVNSISENEGNRESPHGLGLANLKKRLELLYPDKHKLIQTKTNHNYSSFLKIEL